MEDRYKVKSEPVIIELFFDENGEIILDDLKGKKVVAKTTDKAGATVEAYEIDGKEVNTYKESFEFKRPGWGLANRVEGMSMFTSLTGQQLDITQLAFNQLRYYLRKCSLIKLEFEKDAGGVERVKNVDSLVGEQGLKPNIINIALRKFLESV